MKNKKTPGQDGITTKMLRAGGGLKPLILIDTIGGSRLAKRYSYLHFLVDHCIRYTYILTSKTQSANSFVKLINNVTDSYTIGKLLTDQDQGINRKSSKQLVNIVLWTLIIIIEHPSSEIKRQYAYSTLYNQFGFVVK